MNFNSEDPLADLLSDNSIDNDSFFDNPSGKQSKKPAGKGRSKLEDLFGITEENEGPYAPSIQRKSVQNSFGNPTSTLTSSKPAPITSTPRITRQQPSSAFEDDDDLGFDPHKPKSGARSNIFDDLLVPTKAKRPATAAPAVSRREEKSVSRQSTDTTTDASNVVMPQVRPKTSAGRRSSGSGSVAANSDPLGLFSTQTREKEAAAPTLSMSTPKTGKRGSTADWLGLSAEAAEDSADKYEEQTESSIKHGKSTANTELDEKTVEILKIPNNDLVVEATVEDSGSEHKMKQTLAGQTSSPYNAAENILLLNSLNMETKNTFTALQQQESQLSLAVQMKTQEKALLEMQRKQDSLLQQQERQFQALLQQQMQRQQQMEEHIKMQQQRINTHIQLMMTQPTTLSPSMSGVDEMGIGLRGEDAGEKGVRSRPTTSEGVAINLVQMETDTKRLELERLRLEELVESVKTNYEREMELMESSYKKQLKVLEEHLNAVETRLKLDLEELRKYYENKFEALEHEKDKQKADYESDIAALKQDHEDSLRKFKKSHQDDLEMLKEEHRQMLENVRQAKILEFAAVQDSGSYLDALKIASSNLENLGGSLEDLRTAMQLKIDTLSREQQKMLEMREKKLEDAERRLKIAEETAEAEKKRLMDLVCNLEQQLGKLSADSAEENWLLRQKMSSLEAEKAAFEKEKEFMRAQFARDEKRIVDLKEQQLAESQRTLLTLQEERERIFVERTKIETKQKLNVDHDLENQRLEMEAIVKVAQDATRQADAERTRYHNLQRQLERQKRELVDKEHMLRAKEDELDQELNSFRLAESKSVETQQKARQAEQTFHMKIQLLQERMRELGEKEANLSQERLLLTQDRIALQNLKSRLADQKCAICKMGDRDEEMGKIFNTIGANDGAAANDVAVGPKVSNDCVSYAAKDMKLNHLWDRGNVVDRMLDENIAESYRKMKTTTNTDFWAESVLDDDSKKLALHNLNNDLLHEVNELLQKNSTNKY